MNDVYLHVSFHLYTTASFCINNTFKRFFQFLLAIWIQCYVADDDDVGGDDGDDARDSSWQRLRTKINKCKEKAQ